jgi:hypothetical protein
MQQYQCEKFTLEIDNSDLNLSLCKKNDANTFSRMYFYSTLLHSFKPNPQAIWMPGKRLDVEIKGWSKNIIWGRVSETKFEGVIKEQDIFIFEDFCETLKIAIENIVDGIEIEGQKYNKFAIGTHPEWKEYLFKTRSRSICALCILYDLKPHTRNELEVIISNKYHPKTKEPFVTDDETTSRFYGDPSKIVDEMRNEGWTREGDSPTLIVKGGKQQRATQQTYKLTSIEQNLGLQVARTNISSRWKNKLFKSDNYTCKLCHTKYKDQSYLSPDHRIPVVVQADNLTEENYKNKLMTLCTYCNQRKREYTKKLPPDYDWNSSHWAYPEKFQLQKIEEDIDRYSQANQKSFDDVIDDVKKVHKQKDIITPEE